MPSQPRTPKPKELLKYLALEDVEFAQRRDADERGAIVRSTSADHVVREKKMALGEKTQP